MKLILMFVFSLFMVVAPVQAEEKSLSPEACVIVHQLKKAGVAGAYGVAMGYLMTVGLSATPGARAGFAFVVGMIGIGASAAGDLYDHLSVGGTKAIDKCLKGG
jgi:hypothetical protein